MRENERVCVCEGEREGEIKNIKQTRKIDTIKKKKERKRKDVP